MLPFRDGPHLTTKVTAEAVWNLAVAMDSLLAEQPGAGAKPLDLASLPVHFIAHLPRGRIFMHPDTPKVAVRDPWPPPMPAIKDSLKTAFPLDGDGRDGFNGTGPFEG